MLKTYLKIAYRNLRNQLLYTAINIFGLALGMAGAILIFLFLQFHFNTDRHQPFFEQVYRVVHRLHLDEGVEYDAGSSVALASSLSKDYAAVEKTGFIRKIPDATISSTDGSDPRRFVEKNSVVLANQDFMEMFAFSWIGNNPAASMQDPFTAIISKKSALRYYGNTEVTGKILRLNNKHDLRITGVFEDQKNPTDLDYEIFISLPSLKKIERGYEFGNFGWLSGRNQTFIRLPDNAAAGNLQKLIKHNGKKYYGDVAKYYEHILQPLSEVHFDEKYDGKMNRSVLSILGGVGVFLLLIACINFVNLATAQALKRAKEIGVRKVLGSTRGQLFWQFIWETALITLIAALLSLILVVLLLPVMNNWMHTTAFKIEMAFQHTLLLFWLAIIPVVVVIAGFYPAVVISGFNPVIALKSKIGTQQIGGLGLRRILIAIQLLIAQLLVIGSLVLILQLKFFMRTGLGFDQSAIITIQLPDAGLETKEKQFLRNELRRQHDVESVTFQYEAPASTMGYGGSVRFDNRSDWEKFVVRDRFGDEHYLDTYRIPLLAGRNFVVRDSLVEFVVNQEFMQRVGIADPEKMLGRALEDGNSGLKGTIVGVVKSFHLKSLQSAIEPCLIFARPQLYKQMAVKLNATHLANSIENVQKVWRSTYPDEVFDYQFVDDQIASYYNKERQLASLIRTFSLVAVFICCLGLFGMVSFMILQKTKEIGIRKILGAGVASIVLLLGKEFLMLAFGAFVLAVPFSWYVMKNWLSSFVYHIELDWWIFASGGFLILLITMLTVSAKVLRAALMDPVKAVKAE